LVATTVHDPARAIVIELIGPIVLDSRTVIEIPQIDATHGRYAACSPPAGNEQMSQTDELGSAHQRRVDAAVPTDFRRKSLDWAVLVVMFAFGCTLGWIALLLWGAVRAFRIALL